MTKQDILDNKPSEFTKQINEAPLLPGCYIYKNSKGKILYIGKAKVLRNRVNSYFTNFPRLEEKIRQMIMQAEQVEMLVTDSEVEALILESNLIKKYKPKYNSMLTDDKRYVYVRFDKFSALGGKTQRIPSIRTTRELFKDGATYFGPYPDAALVKRLLRRLRKVFPYCVSKNRVVIPSLKSELIKSLDRPCFDHQLGLCSGACAGLVTRGEYEKALNDVRRFFRGEKSALVTELEREMHKSSKVRNFEEAAKVRNMLRDIKYVGSNLSGDEDIDEVLVMQEKENRRARALTELIEALHFPVANLQEHEGFRIECYDISNIQGKWAVGSMVVFVDGQAQPNLYRRFRIKLGEDPNDFAMLQEVLTRRFQQYLRSRLAESEPVDNEGFTLTKETIKKLSSWKPDESFSAKPDLIIIDGGKGQLSATYKILESFQLAEVIPIVGLAKREEEIFKINKQFNSDPEAETFSAKPHLPQQAEDFIRILLPKRSAALYLIQRIRDEAHRFAITYHRKLRSIALRS